MLQLARAEVLALCRSRRCRVPTRVADMTFLSFVLRSVQVCACSEEAGGAEGCCSALLPGDSSIVTTRCAGG
jgi:hypothetical protein